ncbi:hypothetical protein [Sodalis sp. RH22]|uniref:hypothetical protein n=1 Tax=unclassified Sodalis (in: enterobacteria) TaxID=2636512 RepID=UPI0039B36521
MMAQERRDRGYLIKFVIIDVLRKPRLFTSAAGKSVLWGDISAGNKVGGRYWVKVIQFKRNGYCLLFGRMLKKILQSQRKVMQCHYTQDIKLVQKVVQMRNS